MYVLRVGVAAALLGAVVVSSPTPATAADDDPAVISEWNALATTTLLGNPGSGAPPASALYLGFVHAAMYDAVVGVAGGYEPYHFRGTAATGSSAPAAAVAAAHQVLVTYAPYATATLDAARAASLARIPDSQAKKHGITFGTHVARHFVKLRADDGRDAPTTFDPDPGPGVWEPTPPGFAPMLYPWLGGVRPLLIESGDQFDPGPPPALTSAQYAADYNEVLTLGRRNSPARSADQTATATFFSGNPLIQYQTGLRDQVTVRGLDIVEAARMFAAVNMSVADAAIVTWWAKAYYWFWRPITAIARADTDENSATIADSTWVPQVNNPPYPDYPSGYNAVNATLARTLSRVFDTDELDLTLTSTAAPGVTRHYDSEAALCEDVVSARVWLGIHFRFADTAARDIGFAVADYAMDNYFAPTG